MRNFNWILIASGLLVTSTRADDSAAARALIDAAIVAHGGEAALAKWPCVTVKTKGIWHGYDRTPVFFFTCEWTNHGPEQTRLVLNGELNKQKFLVANVLNGKQGWVKMAGNGKEETREATSAELLDRRASVYASWLGTLLPLKNPEFTLRLAGEDKVDGPAIGVRVSSNGHRDVTLYFDKETRLVVKAEMRSMAGTGVEGRVEATLQQHKTFQGTQLPTMMMVKHNGRPLMSYWVLDYQLAEAPAAGMFGKP